MIFKGFAQDAGYVRIGSNIGGKIMSMTPSMAFSPDYWTYSSEVMIRCIDKFIKTKKIVSDDLQKGIYSHSTKFFELAMKGEDYSLAHPANRAAHFTLFQFICSLPNFKNTTNEAVNAEIIKMHDFHATLVKDREMDEEDLSQAHTLLKLYQVLKRQGYDDRARQRGPGCF